MNDNDNGDDNEYKTAVHNMTGCCSMERGMGCLFAMHKNPTEFCNLQSANAT